jgi:hypothetical protein
MTTIGFGMLLLLLGMGMLYGIAYCVLLLIEYVQLHRRRWAETRAERRDQRSYLPADRRRPRRPARLATFAPSPAHPSVRGQAARDAWAAEAARAAHRARLNRQALLERDAAGGRHRLVADTGRHHVRRPVPDSGRAPRHAKPEFSHADMYHPDRAYTDQFDAVESETVEFNVAEFPTEEIYSDEINTEDQYLDELQARVA